MTDHAAAAVEDQHDLWIERFAELLGCDAQPGVIAASIGELKATVDKIPSEIARNRAAAIAAARTENAARIAELEALLAEAADDIAGWGGYASVWFQDKYDLEGCVQRYRAAAAAEESKGAE